MCFALVSGAGCAAPLEAPSAYGEERYLCGQEHASEFDAWASACTEVYNASRSCLGVASMKGVSAGEPFAVDSNLVASYVPSDTPFMGLEYISADGASPYFGFSLSLIPAHLAEPARLSWVSKLAAPAKLSS
jgi:hypothetical protein